MNVLTLSQCDDRMRALGLGQGSADIYTLPGLFLID